MFEITGLNIADRITIVSGRRHYVSTVQDQIEPDRIVVSWPSLRGSLLRLTEDDMVEIIFKRPNGVMSFQAFQVARVDDGGLRLLHFRAASPVVRRQRRNFFRLDKVMPVKLTLLDPETGEEKALTGQTVNLSGGGCRLVPGEPLDYGMRLRCVLPLGVGSGIDVEGEVVWVDSETERGRNPLVGIRFENVKEGTRMRIIAFITQEQRKLLTQRRK